MLFRKIITVITLICFTAACATIVPPTGGPKDITPPKITHSSPANGSTHFSGNEISITFDEYVQLKDIDKALLISPPLKELPNIKLKGHTLLMKFKDTLRSNTTYNFNFGDAIRDLNEGNALKNYSLAFSTGNTIDSLSIIGVVSDAFTRLPMKDVLVMLYNSLADSIPMKQLPLYATRTNENGSFFLTSLPSANYKVFALKDGNNDYLYNLPNEMIGFYPKDVNTAYIKQKPTDTTTKTKLGVKGIEPDPNSIQINLFPQPDSIQRIVKSGMVSTNKCAIVFRYPAQDVSIQPLKWNNTDWNIKEWSQKHDTINLWLKDKPDTLNLLVNAKGMKPDTLVFSTTLNANKNAKTPPAAKARFTTNLNGNQLDYNNPLKLTFSNPISDADFNKLILTCTKEKDTLKPQISFTDSIRRQLGIKYNWENEKEYKLFLTSGAITDMYAAKNDSSALVFKVTPREQYGTFAVNVKQKQYGYPIIVQLLAGDKGTVVAEKIITGPQKVSFGILKPDKYSIRAIIDANRNGKWDTGIFLKGIQPEEVLMHPKQFDVRANWELEEDWEL